MRITGLPDGETSLLKVVATEGGQLWGLERLPRIGAKDTNTHLKILNCWVTLLAEGE